MARKPTPEFKGPTILSYGFRPFFFLGAAYTGLSMILWLPQLYGSLQLSTLFSPSDWHVHELFFGFLSAVITGFLFTAVPNWTGRMPVRGFPLLILVVIWIAGRLAISFSVHFGWFLTMIVDLGFLMSIAIVIGTEIIIGKNWRNLLVLLPLLFLLVANFCFHIEAHYEGVSEISRRVGMSAVLTLIMLIGGRVIPSFTLNWLKKENPGRLPASFNWFDGASILVAVSALGIWAFVPLNFEVGMILGAAGILQFIRLIRWVGYRTSAEPLVFMLHVSYLFIPVGFILLALSGIWPEVISNAAGIHAFGVGAIGSMTLSVMIRATLGHSGQLIKAGRGASVIFGAIILAAISRIGAEFIGGFADNFLMLAAIGWSIAFLGFSILFAPSFYTAKK